MTNQQFNQQSFGNQSSMQIVLAKRFYSIHTLPKEIQAKLLRLQNTTGDFLRLRGASTLWWLVLLLPLALFAFAFYILIVGLVFGSAIFFIWIAYFVWKFYKTPRSPIRNHIYLTPTQLIETKGGYVRFRELKDVREIEFRTIRGKGGSTYFLICKFNDNDSFKYIFPIGMFSSKTAEANFWKDKAVMWRNYAINEFQNKDAAYFNSWNIFQGLSETNTPVVKKKSGILLFIMLLLITFSLPVISIIAYSFANSARHETELWNTAISKNTVTYYQLYIKGTRGKHTEEAIQKINGFYDETTKKIKENQANAADTKGVEAVLSLLESAKVKQDNQVILKLSGVTYSYIEDDFYQKISLQFKKMFPAETLYIKEKSYRSASENPLVSSMEVKISTPIEPTKTPSKKTKGNSNLDTANVSEKKYDFSCVISVPDKPKYGFEIKSATIEDFNNELAKRFGLATPY